MNDKFQVICEDGSVIKGLYAGGEVINRPYYNRVYTSGTGLGIAYTFGRIAGTNAAQAQTPQAKSYLETEVCHWSSD